MRKKRLKLSDNRNLFSIISCIIILLYCLTMVGVLAWGFITSVKDSLDFLDNKFGLPSPDFGWKLSTYIDTFKAFKVPVGISDVFLPTLFLNSLIFTLVTTLESTVVPMAVAYVVAKYRFKLGRVLYSVVIITMILPIVGAMPSMLRVLRLLNLFDNYFGIIAMRFSFIGIYFLVFYSCFTSISSEYMEAARIDGAGNWHIFLRIMVPLAIPVISGVFLLQFISHWNDYTLQMIYLPSRPTIAYALYRLNTTTIQRFTTPMKMAACILCAIPIFVLFMLTKKKIMGNVNVGGLKG